MTDEAFAHADGYVRRTMWKRRTTRKAGWLLAVLNLAVWIVVGVLWAHHRNKFGQEASWWLAGTVVWVVLSYWAYRVIVVRFTRRLSAGGKLHVGNQTLSLSDAEFTITSGPVSTTVPYKAIQNVEEDTVCVYLVADDLTIFYLPKDTVTPSTILEELRKRLEHGA